jgi:Glycosyl hydrolases family 16
MDFRESFESLDPSVWTSAYLPAWSSRTAAAATHTVGDGLVLSIPAEQPLWCPDLHPTPLRVSGIHSANRSGEVGSRNAPQPFLPGQVVREAQPTVMGFVPYYGRISVTCSAVLDARSMFSAWMVGLEDEPERSGEICLVEVFGNTVQDGQADVGQGIKQLRDPALRQEFSAEPMALDVSDEHRYEINWRPDGVTFLVDGSITRETSQSPDYPMMLILGVFDFPDGASEAGIPELHVTEVAGTDLGPGSLLGG